MPNGSAVEEPDDGQGEDQHNETHYTPDAPEQIFLGEHVLHKARLADSLSDYLFTLIKTIDEMSLTIQCKNELAVLINGAFDKTNVLAKIENPTIPIIDFELALNKAKMGFTIYDINQPELITTLSMVRNAYALFISRAKDGFEIKQQHKLSFYHESDSRTQNGNQPQQPVQQKKRGFRMPFG